MPLSSSPMINREEIIELLEEALHRMPDELRQARWMLKERQDFIDKTKREAEDILDAGRAQAERMVQRTEVVRAAEMRARKIVEAAENEARRMKLEIEDFCDQRLASFEILLERTLKTVAVGPGEAERPDERHPAAGAAEPEPGPTSSTRTVLTGRDVSFLVLNVAELLGGRPPARRYELSVPAQV